LIGSYVGVAGFLPDVLIAGHFDPEVSAIMLSWDVID
jgi:hypothetical protein